MEDLHSNVISHLTCLRWGEVERFGLLVHFPGYYSACSGTRTSTCFAGKILCVGTFFWLGIILLLLEPGLAPVPAFSFLERFCVLVCFPEHYSACSRARTSTRTCFVGCQRSRQDSMWNPSRNRLLQMSQEFIPEALGRASSWLLLYMPTRSL